MKLKVLLVLFLIHSTAVHAQKEVYKSVDEQGNTVFSDTQTTDSEKIEIQDIQTVPALENFPEYYHPTKPVERYSGINIISPDDDTTIWDNGGSLTVSVSIEPQLLAPDKIVLFLDGKEYASGTSAGFNLTEIDRGTHTLQVSIRSALGDITISSKVVTFHLKQNSILNRPTSNNFGPISQIDHLTSMSLVDPG